MQLALCSNIWIRCNSVSSFLFVCRPFLLFFVFIFLVILHQSLWSPFRGTALRCIIRWYESANQQFVVICGDNKSHQCIHKHAHLHTLIQQIKKTILSGHLSEFTNISSTASGFTGIRNYNSLTMPSGHRKCHSLAPRSPKWSSFD